MPREIGKASAEQPAGRVAFPVPVQEHAFPERERDRYVSRSLGYVVLLNGAAALILMAVVALNPESTSHLLALAMIVSARFPARRGHGPGRWRGRGFPNCD